MAYTEQITFLLFLKMADEQSKPPYNKKIVPKGLDWASLLQRDGEELQRHYRHILDELGKESGMLRAILKKTRQDIQNPATLRRENRRFCRHRELVQHAGRYQRGYLRRAARKECLRKPQRRGAVLYARISQQTVLLFHIAQLQIQRTDGHADFNE
ncbi:putative type I restriction enzymeP M protein [Novipirellula aureliae]|uniref:Putative type I restriction enzymeP M protein n=1 Tax=Novipirellula aureliae TaxID=2527966 RepID=A0A5C6DK25_9BACT|nr:putative type I restriction enzymeP M protein [Novipirellula aureliae]